MFYKIIMVSVSFIFIFGCKDQENKYADSPVGACFVTKDKCRVGYSVEATPYAWRLKLLMRDTNEFEFYYHPHAFPCKERYEVPSCGLIKYEDYHQD